MFNFITVNEYDYKKHSQCEVFCQPSLTDPSEYETLEQILEKCLRGQYSIPKVDGFEPDVSDDEILNSLSPQDSVDFDISDRTEIDFQKEMSLRNLKNGAKAPKNEDSTKKTSEEGRNEENRSEDQQA